MKLITRKQLLMRLDEGDVKLVFVLGDWYYRAKHIPGSIHIDMIDDAGKLLHKSDEIVVYCASETCPASIYAYHLLAQKGYKKLSRYAGGIADWEKAGLPLEGEMIEPIKPAKKNVKKVRSSKRNKKG